MNRAGSVALWLAAGCGEPTIYPHEPPPPWGELGGLLQCSGIVAETGTGVVTIDNRLDEELVLGYVDAECEEAPVGPIAAAERLELEVTFGQVYTVRAPDSLFLFAAFQATADGPTDVVIE